MTGWISPPDGDPWRLAPESWLPKQNSQAAQWTRPVVAAPAVAGVLVDGNLLQIVLFVIVVLLLAILVGILVARGGDKS